MAACNDNLNSVLSAAQTLLDYRRAGMDTIDEWLALARAVATCTERQTAGLLTARDLEHVAEYGLPWSVAKDGPLPADERD